MGCEAGWCNKTSLEGWPTKAKEALSPHEVGLTPLDTNPVFQCLWEAFLNLKHVNVEILSKNFSLGQKGKFFQASHSRSSIEVRLIYMLGIFIYIHYAAMVKKSDWYICGKNMQAISSICSIFNFIFHIEHKHIKHKTLNILTWHFPGITRT